MKHTSFIELSRKALRKNLKFIRKHVNGSTFYSVVKGNAYGHGIEQFVPMLFEEGMKSFAVFDTEEAYRIKQVIHEPCEILIMGYIHLDDLEWVISENIQFYVFDLYRLEKAIELGKKLGKPARIHLELETGFHRAGFEGKDLQKAIELIKAHPGELSFEGLCTHYAGAENLSNDFRVKQQIENFNKAKRWIESLELSPKLYHTACSAASLSYENTLMDMSRIGILQYGFWPSKESYIYYLTKHPEERNPLKRVISWKSRIMAIKTVPAGEYIGYGSTYLAEKETKIAIIPVGYAYGYSRSLSNLGRVLIKGMRLTVVGIVNMNMIAVNINAAPDAEPGEEVVLIGNQGNLSISVASFSEMSNQLNYEMLTRLPERIPRIVVD